MQLELRENQKRAPLIRIARLDHSRPLGSILPMAYRAICAITDSYSAIHSVRYAHKLCNSYIERNCKSKHNWLLYDDYGMKCMKGNGRPNVSR
jgi:hypothetical protein